MQGTICAGLSDRATALNSQLKIILSSLDSYNILLYTLSILYPPPQIVYLTGNSEYILFLFTRIISKFCLIKILVFNLINLNLITLI